MDTAPRDRELPAGVTKVIAASKMPVVIADPTLPDTPLVFLNDAFSKMTGYACEEVIGRNCRFLQPDQGAGPVRDRIRAFLKDSDARQDRFVIPNLRKDGTRFLNLLYLAKLKTGTGAQWFLGSQFDITSATVDTADAYDRALANDLSEINALTSHRGWSMLGSTSVLASSFETILQAKLDE